MTQLPPPSIAARPAWSLPRTTLLIALLATSLALPACRVGPRNYENENDRLREQNLELSRQVEQLQQTLTRREDELNAAHQQLTGAQPLPGVKAPTVATLKLGRYSGPIDTDGDGRDDTVRLYVRPMDSHGRLYPAEGEADARVVLLDNDEDPVVLAERAFEPDAFRAAYRTGLTGRHFTLELPLNEQAPAGQHDVAAQVVFTDAATGAEHTASATYKLSR